MAFEIRLASPTPTFVPIHLAKQRNRGGHFNDVQITYDDDASGDGRTTVDPLIQKLLFQQPIGVSPKILFAACDPLRAVLSNHLAQGEPWVASGLVKNMFFWLINDGALIDNEEEIPQQFRRLIVTPRHMTGYAVALYDLVKNLNVVDIKQADKHLYTDTIPGFEEDQWRHFQNARKSGEQGFAYLTTNIFDYFSKFPGGRVIRKYPDLPEFRDCVMTALVANKEVYHQNQGKSDEVLIAIHEAIHDIYKDPEMAAYELRNYRDERIRFDDYDRTLGTLEYLVDKEAFAPNGAILPSQIVKSLELRRNAAAFISTDDHRRKLDTPDEISRFFKTAPEECSPPPVTLQHAGWIRPALVKERELNVEAEQEIAKRSRAGLVISLILLALELIITAAEALEAKAPALRPIKDAVRIIESICLVLPIFHDVHLCIIGNKRIFLNYDDGRNIYYTALSCFLLLSAVIVIRNFIDTGFMVEQFIGLLLTVLLVGAAIGLAMIWWQSNRDNSERRRWKRRKLEEKEARRIRKLIAKVPVPESLTMCQDPLA